MFVLKRRVPTAMLLVGSMLLPAFARPVCAEGTEEAYFEQLRRRRLFSLIEGYCLERLARKTLSSRQHAALTLEFSRTLAEHAGYTLDGEQDDLWKRAAEVIDVFLKAEPTHPSRIVLEIQRALVSARQADFARWQAELLPYDARLVSKAQAAVDDGLARLKKIESELIGEIGRAMNRTVLKADLMPTHELRRHLDRARYELGLLHMNRGKLFPPATADRVEAFLEAEDWLRKTSADQYGKPVWISRLRLSELSRLQGRLKRAEQQLQSITQAGPRPSQEIIEGVVAGRVDLLLRQHKPFEAARQLVPYRNRKTSFGGELHFFSVKATLAILELADGKGEAVAVRRLQREAEMQADRASREVGGYWAYRCRLLLHSSLEAQKYGATLAKSIRTAESLARDKKFDRAIDEYGRAVAEAKRTGKTELAAELAFKRASMQYQTQTLTEAAESFHDLAKQFPAHPRASEGHLMWAYCLGRLYDQRRTKGRRVAYTDALEAHRKLFAGSATGHEATWMLARLEEIRLQVSRALKLYLEIPITHRRGPQAQAAVARCYETILKRLQTMNRSTEGWKKKAAGKLNGFIAGFPKEPVLLSLPQAEVCIRLARLLMNGERPGYAESDRLLHRVLASWQQRGTGQESTEKSTDKAGWLPLLKAARQLRIVALAGRRRFKDAEALLRNLSNSRPDEALTILDGLTQISIQMDETKRRRLGALQLKAAEQLNLRRAELNNVQQERLDRCLAEAYLATNQPLRSAEIYEQLLLRTPDDKRLRESLAEVLIRNGTRASLIQAKKHWHKLQSAQKAGSLPWLNARYQIAWCSFALKDYDNCRKLLKITRVLYPELGGTELKTRFLQLQAALDKQSSS